MAVRWSSENVVAEHRELQANAMALNWRGEYCLLAGRRTLALIALDKPCEVVKRVSRTQQKYDVIAAEWNPMQAQGHTFVLASGERAEICQWNDGSLNCTTSLKAHTRTITDLNWHRFDPHLLATCSIDTFVHIWDTRETRKPIASLSSIAGASQVKWNKLNHNFLASGHDSDIRVWDNRKINQPIQYIAAHLSKIQGLDWSPNHENQLVTSSNDCTVKFFDITNPRKAENSISTLSPVWRARYTPFGEGVVTVVVPQLRRGENSLLLWSVSDVSSPVHTFVGHSDVVLEFEWQQGPSSPGVHHLVTWARDHSLRIWKIDQQLQRLCGHDAEEESILGLESTDTEFVPEATTLIQAETEEVKEETLGKSVEGESMSESVEASVSGEQLPSQASSAQSYTLDGLPESSENTEKAPDSLPDSTSTLDKVMNEDESSEITKKNSQESVADISEAIDKNEMIDKDDHDKSKAAVEDCDTHLMMGDTTSQLQNNKDLQGKPSSAPADATGTGSSGVPLGSSAATQPMSLQQEFSLLNTSQDTTQVNSVEVVAGGGDVLADEDSSTKDDKRSNDETNEEPRVSEPQTKDHCESEEEKSPSVLCKDGNDDMEQDREKDRESQETNAESECKESQAGHDSKDVQKPLDLNHKLVDQIRLAKSSNLDSSDLIDSSNVIIKTKEIESATCSGLESADTDTTKPVMVLVQVASPDKSMGDSSILTKPEILEESQNPVISVNLEDLEAGILGGDSVIKMESLDKIKGGFEEIDKVSQEGLLVSPLSNEVAVKYHATKELPLEAHMDVEEEAEVVIHIEGPLPRDTDCLTKNPIQVSSNNEILLEQLESSIDSTNAETFDAVIMNGSLILSDSSQVQAKLIYLPTAEEQNYDFSQEACTALAPQLLDNNILITGENLIIFGSSAYVAYIEMIETDGETLSKISVSPLAEPLEAYNQRGVNFIIISRDFEQYVDASSSTPLQNIKLSLSTRPSYTIAPRKEEQGPYKCDKCDKSYKKRSSLASHRVTHNAEKLYKCEECGKGFHYNTPLQVHKRVHSAERPYKCPICPATFRARTSLKYHERVHSGEEPVQCHDCDQRFKDHTALKRHKQKVHDILIRKCKVCGAVCGTLIAYINHLWEAHNMLYADKLIFCEKCGEALVNIKAYNAHMVSHRQIEKILRGAPQKKLDDYTHQCGICNMITHNKPQMISHIQVHAAVKRFTCKYCDAAYMYRFLLAEHCRNEHPNDPQWFCQYCDETFETCRKLNCHSCRSLKGDYFCPHCKFQTNFRHRLFKHIIKDHPEDKTPYHCEFCESCYEKPSRLRYHQKREHPDKVLLLTISRETSRQMLGYKQNAPAIDVSQIEMSVGEDTITYSIPKDLRNDEVFEERVKFKCYYCDSKFPVKHAMTRHIVKEHPSELAYKCLKCNIFFKSNIASKNHNRRYHKFKATGGRDPERNVKALKKKVQEFQEKIKQGDPDMEKDFRFRCRFCPMFYRSKRPLLVHYRKCHPNEEWDYFPEQKVNYHRDSSPKKRRLLFYHCSFNDECSTGFDDMKLLSEHLKYAHDVPNEDAEKYVKTKVVIDNVRRGRVPKNAIDVVPKKVRKYIKQRKIKTPKSDNEEEIDDPLSLDEENEDNKKTVKTKIAETEAKSDSKDKSDNTSLEKQTKVTSTISRKQEKRKPKNLYDIYSRYDVQKILYRCRKCNLSFSTKSEYRNHNSLYENVDCREALDMNIKREVSCEEDVETNSDYIGSDDYQLMLSSEDDDDDDDDDESEEETIIRKVNKTMKTEGKSDAKKGLQPEGIHITDGDGSENVLKILTISENDQGTPEVSVNEVIWTKVEEKSPPTSPESTKTKTQSPRKAKRNSAGETQMSPLKSPNLANAKTQSPSKSKRDSADKAQTPVKNSVTSKTHTNQKTIVVIKEEPKDKSPVSRKRGRVEKENGDEEPVVQRMEIGNEKTVAQKKKEKVQEEKQNEKLELQKKKEELEKEKEAEKRTALKKKEKLEKEKQHEKPSMCRKRVDSEEEENSKKPVQQKKKKIKVEEKEDQKPVLGRRRSRLSDAAEKTFCESCNITFSTRAEFNFHMRYSH